MIKVEIISVGGRVVDVDTLELKESLDVLRWVYKKKYKDSYGKFAFKTLMLPVSMVVAAVFTPLWHFAVLGKKIYDDVRGRMKK